MSDTSLYALVYSSDAIGSITEGALQEILEQARRRNERLDVTGILLYREGRFVQYLEGSHDNVLAVYDDIAVDARHTDVRVLLQQPVLARRFSSWTMGYEALRDAPSALPEGCRNTFAEIERADDPARVLRALSELTLWFHVRAMRA